MATNKQLKFYKGASAPATLAAGMIWFCTTDRTIRVCTGTEWEKYSGLVNAEWVSTDKKLNITSANGTVTTLDLSDCASASDITSKLTTINNTLTSHDGRITAAQSAADSANAKIGDGFTKDSTVSAQLAAVKATADAAAVKATVDAELAKKADAEQVSKDIAAAKEGAEATAAADATSKANKAKEDAIAEAVRLDGLMDARVDALEAAVGTGGSVDEAITAKIEDLDADVTSAEGTQVRVQVVEVDGKVTEVKVTESATFATAQALADEIADRAADEQAIAGRIALLDTAETGRVSVLEKQVAALNAATHFEGKVEFDPSAEGATTEGYQAGDIVIYGNKEYIFDGSAWIELGDTTAESGRITALEGLVGSTSVNSQIDSKIAGLDATAGTTTVADGKHVAVEVVEVDGKLTAVNVGEKDIASAAKLSEIEGEVDLNTGAVADHKTRIEALEATSKALGTTYVKVSDYNTYKSEVSGKFTAVEGRVSDLEGFKTTTDAALESIAKAQGVQDQGIVDAKALGQKGIDDAAAALAEAKEKVATVTAGDYISVGNDAKNPVISVNVIGKIAEGNTGLVNGGAIFNELCWVDFD